MNHWSSALISGSGGWELRALASPELMAMPSEISNDNISAVDDATLQRADPNGQAAMLLVESLLHFLIARWP
jgi:hypothetical protein